MPDKEILAREYLTEEGMIAGGAKPSHLENISMKLEDVVQHDLSDDIFLVHAQGKKAVSLDALNVLSKNDQELFSDLMEAHVCESRAGELGTEIVIDGIEPERLEELSEIPKHAHGTVNLPRKTSSVRSIMDAVLGIYDEKVDSKLSVRRITITANKIVSEDDVPQESEAPVQFDLFDDIAAQERQHKDEETRLERERKIQEAMLDIKKKFGKNAILNGGSYLDGATARERNGQIGGHKA